MMNRLLALLAAIFAIALIYAAVTAPMRPVLWSLSVDPTELRPRNYCIMNPFRDRDPERAADRFLEALRNKDRRSLVLMKYDRIEREIEYPSEAGASPIASRKAT